MSAIGNHRVRVVVEGKQIDGWIEYTISSAMLVAADSFSLTRAFDLDAWKLCRPDAQVKVFIDDTQVLTGYIDDRELIGEEDIFTITGRDGVGRLVQESAYTLEFRGLSVAELIKRLAIPWFSVVTESNERNRKILRGKKGRLAIAGSEPVVLKGKKGLGTRIEPGQTRWAAILDVAKQTGHLVWSSGDGRELIVGTPNYNQEPQFFFFRPKSGSLRTAEGNVLALSERHSVGDRYARIDVAGSGTGNLVQYGTSVTQRFGTALNNPADADGVGIDFLYPKTLLMLEGVQSIAEAGEFARREMARRDVDALKIQVTAPLHGQKIRGGGNVTLFACDTVARVENEATGLRISCLIVSCTYTSTRKDGERTQMELIPVGRELFL